MKQDIPKLQTYLRKTFNCPRLRIVAQPKKKDMAEVFIDEEFIATIYREEEDGEVSYQFQMGILDMDLEDV